MLGGLSPAGVNVGLRAVRVVEARLVVRVSVRVTRPVLVKSGWPG